MLRRDDTLALAVEMGTVDGPAGCKSPAVDAGGRGARARWSNCGDRGEVCEGNCTVEGRGERRLELALVLELAGDWGVS